VYKLWISAVDNVINKLSTGFVDSYSQFVDKSVDKSVDNFIK